jgi:pimeloyl-ACP methyl ester carboxylesterase
MTTTVCLHSSASSPKQWRKLTKELSGYRHCLAPALFGYHGGRLEYDRGHSIDREVDAVMTQLSCASERLDVVGHSYGGAVALELARRYPGRVNSLVLYEPVCMPLLFADGQRRSHALESWNLASAVWQAVEVGALHEAAEQFVDYWSGTGTWHSFPDSTRTAISACMPKVASEFQAIFSAGWTCDAFSGISCPTLVIKGTASPAPVGAIANLLRQTLPNSELLTLQGFGHMAPVTNADPVNLHITEHLERSATSKVLAAA